MAGGREPSPKAQPPPSLYTYTAHHRDWAGNQAVDRVHGFLKCRSRGSPQCPKTHAAGMRSMTVNRRCRRFIQQAVLGADLRWKHGNYPRLAAAVTGRDASGLGFCRMNTEARARAVQLETSG